MSKSKFNQVEYYQSKSNREIEELITFWEDRLNIVPHLARNALAILRVTRAERVGK